MQQQGTFTLCAFADEAGAALEAQLAALKRNDIHWLEVRAVDGKNVSDLTAAEARALRRRLDEAGIRVWALGSPLGKIPLDAPLAPHLEQMRRTLEVGAELGAHALRLFSFYLPPDADPDACWPQVAERMDKLLAVAADAPLLLCHENEKGIYGATAARCARLHAAFPQLRAVFDPANFIQCGQPVWPAWQLLAPQVAYLHVKDALADGSVVPAGQGLGCWPQLLAAYRAGGGQMLTLEPHLSVFEGLQALERAGEASHAAFCYPDADAAFDAAAAALRALL